MTDAKNSQENTVIHYVINVYENGINVLYKFVVRLCDNNAREQHHTNLR